ncbi:MAG: FAD-dependent thymidylate synthase [Candidatus ainarchaeum sp.]|nr:FAD-dependent thymidylate synthase [Candidatus ainarchaeum sp.]
MELELFETNFVQIDELENYLINLEKEHKKINEETFCELTKNINISFSIENCSRLLSHHICESLDSYTQQSQRYVKMGKDAFILPKEIEESEFNEEYINLNEEIFEFYNKISEMKEGFSGRKATENDYKYGIKIEDARYILPLSTKTNIFVTLNFSKIINFFIKIKRMQTNESEELLEKIISKFPNQIKQQILNKSECKLQEKIIENYYKTQFEKINDVENCVLLNNFNDLIERTGLGALTSTNALGASEIKKDWIKNNFDIIEKTKSVTERVLGYNHTSIIEHARTTFGLMMSLTCYHQFERHRLSNNVREEFNKIEINRNIIIPESIKRNKEILEEFKKIIDKVKILRKKLEANGNKQEYLLLNCDLIKIINSTNARIDNEVMKERTCNNAQWEIRQLYEKKLISLKKLAQIIYDQAGPPCTKGPCPEGKLTCGRIIEMREKYNSKLN